MSTYSWICPHIDDNDNGNRIHSLGNQNINMQTIQNQKDTYSMELNEGNSQKCFLHVHPDF